MQRATVPDWGGLYIVTSDGFIYNKNTTVKRVGSITKQGYRRLVLAMGKKRISYQVHRLVAQAFIPNPNNLPEVNHKDGNKLNNHVSNLEWVSATGNKEHYIKLKESNMDPKDIVKNEFRTLCQTLMANNKISGYAIKNNGESSLIVTIQPIIPTTHINIDITHG